VELAVGRQVGEVDGHLELLTEVLGPCTERVSEERPDRDATHRRLHLLVEIDLLACRDPTDAARRLVGDHRQVALDAPDAEGRLHEPPAARVVGAVGHDERGVTVDGDEALERLAPLELLVAGRQDELVGVGPEEVHEPERSVAERAHRAVALVQPEEVVRVASEPQAVPQLTERRAGTREPAHGCASDSR
jgi:hypothetical protein